MWQRARKVLHLQAPSTLKDKPGQPRQHMAGTPAKDWVAQLATAATPHANPTRVTGRPNSIPNNMTSTASLIPQMLAIADVLHFTATRAAAAEQTVPPPRPSNPPYTSSSHPTRSVIRQHKLCCGKLWMEVPVAME
jgi:hypothetical protein